MMGWAKRRRLRWVGLIGAVAMGLCLSLCVGQAWALGPGASEAVSWPTVRLGFETAKWRESADYSEQITLRARFDGGGKLYARLLITNIAGGDGRAELSVHLSGPKEAKVHHKIRMKRGTWTYEKGRFDVRLGKNRLVLAEDGGRLILVMPGLDVDLHIGSPLRPFRPTGGNVDFGDGKTYATTVLLPRGRLRGKVKITGEDEVVFDGRGQVYGEQRVGNIAPYLMSKHWVQWVDVGRTKTVVLSSFKRPSRLGGQGHGWSFAANDHGYLWMESEVDLKLGKFQSDRESGYGVPRELALVAHGKAIGVIKADKILSRTDDLQDLNPFLRRVVSALMHPWTFRMNGRYLIKTAGKAWTGKASYTYQQLQ